MIKTKKLDSGITLVMEQIPYLQSIAMGIWVKAGSVDETPEYAGISHYIEHMMFKGTTNRSARQIAEDIDKIGGQINAFTGKEATCYYVKTISSNYHKAADVIIDMLENSLFDTEEMNKERQVICEEIKMTLDTPDELAHDTITSIVFEGTALGNSIIGTPETLDRIDHDVMVEYVKNQYTRDSIIISVCGNYDEDELCTYFDKKLSVLKESKQKRKIETGNHTPQFKCITKDIEQTHICLATKGISNIDPSYYAFGILNNIMGGSMSSRFFQNVREQKGLAYSVYSMMGSFTDDGYYNIYAGVSHDKIEEAVQAIREELYLLEKEGITKDELESSREQLKSAYIFAQENVAGRMFKNGKNLLLSGRIIEPEEVVAGFDNVTMEDIEKIKGRICKFDEYSGVAVTKNEVDMKKFMRG